MSEDPQLPTFSCFTTQSSKVIIVVGGLGSENPLILRTAALTPGGLAGSRPLPEFPWKGANLSCSSPERSGALSGAATRVDFSVSLKKTGFLLGVVQSIAVV